MATAGADETARLWRVSDWQEVHCMKHQGEVCSVAFSPDSKYLATASSDKTVRVWEVNQCLEVSRILHKEAVRAVAFSSEGKYLAIASADGTARLELWQSEDLINEASSRLTHNITGDRIQ